MLGTNECLPQYQKAQLFLYALSTVVDIHVYTCMNNVLHTDTLLLMAPIQHTSSSRERRLTLVDNVRDFFYPSTVLGQDSLIVEEDDLPRIDYKPPPEVPAEMLRTGCNKKVYFVCTERKIEFCTLKLSFFCSLCTCIMNACGIM